LGEGNLRRETGNGGREKRGEGRVA
jgi:hypothetical protein